MKGKAVEWKLSFKTEGTAAPVGDIVDGTRAE